MLSIQIDTKSLELVSSSTSNCPSLQAIRNRVFHYVRLIDAVRLLDPVVHGMSMRRGQEKNVCLAIR